MPETDKSQIQLIVFHLAGREYALPMENVREVLRMVALRPIPRGPEWLPGVLNLRGQVIPVIDLRIRLGLPIQAPGLNAAIIISEAHGQVAGLIADAATDVLTVSTSHVSPPDRLAGRDHATSAIARKGTRLILILNLEELLGDVPMNAALPIPER